MHVIFIEPAFPRSQREFVRGLHQAGAHVTGIGEAPLQALDPELRQWMHSYEQVGSVVHEPSLEEAVRNIQSRGWVDRLEATVEAHMNAAARVREACDIPGTSVRTTFLCRDKPAMKEVLREAGVACAQSTGATSAEEVREFAAKVGYPLILKPADAAGAAGTYKVDNDEELEQAIQTTHVEHGASVAVEEYIEGHEGFYDTICHDGKIVHDFASHYYPNVLEAMRTRWISPQIVSTNRLDLPEYDEVKEMGRKVIEVLGIETSATHMEWFFGPKGLKFSEIGCRPPGVGQWDVYSAGNDLDLYEEWAKVITTGKTDAKPSRAYASGILAIRPDQDGTVSSYEGREAIMQKYGDSIFKSHFPPPGSGTQSVSGGYMANAWMQVRHPDYDELCRILNDIGENLKMHAE